MLTPWRRRTEMFCSTRLASMPVERRGPLSGWLDAQQPLAQRATASGQKLRVSRPSLRLQSAQAPAEA